jgi:hypothetical protein
MTPLTSQYPVLNPHHSRQTKEFQYSGNGGSQTLDQVDLSSLGGVSSVMSGNGDPFCIGATADIRSGGGDFPPGCFQSSANEVKSGTSDLNFCLASETELKSGGGDFPPGCFQSSATDVKSGGGDFPPGCFQSSATQVKSGIIAQF